MGVQNIVLRNRKLTNFVMSHISPDSHAKRGEKNALNVLKSAVRADPGLPRLSRVARYAA